MVRCALATSGNLAGYGRRAKLRWPAAVPGMRPHTVRRAAPVTVFLPGEENLGRYNHERLATHLPVVWMVIVIFAATYLFAAVLYTVITALAR